MKICSAGAELLHADRRDEANGRFSELRDRTCKGGPMGPTVDLDPSRNRKSLDMQGLKRRVAVCPTRSLITLVTQLFRIHVILYILWNY
jgi:hypothetical protein